MSESAPNVDSLIGLTLDNGRYEVVKLIGEGGMGRVFQARQVSMDRMVAIKVLRAQLAGDEHLLARFQQEALSVSRLRHPNTITVFDYGRTEDGFLFIAMELLGGRSLADLLQTEKRLEAHRALHIIEQVCGAVAEAHQYGIVHRDLKPENIQIDDVANNPDFAKVLDFGIAKIIHGDTEAAETKTLTIAGTVFGTPHYMSPEQVHGNKVDHRTDVYALGCILYELLTGEPPFQGATPMAVMMAQASKDPPEILEHTEADATEAIADIIAACLIKNRDERIQSATELLERIEEAGADLMDGTSSVSISQRVIDDDTGEVRADRPTGPRRWRRTSQPEKGAGGAGPSEGGRPKTGRPRPPTVTPEYSGQLSTHPPAVDENDDLDSDLLDAPKRRGIGLWLVAALILIAAGGGGVFYYLDQQEPPPAPIEPAAAVESGPVRIKVHGADKIKYWLRSSPTAATVKLDDQVLGKTPLSITRAEGETPTLFLEREGYAAAKITLPGSGARRQEIPVDLVQLESKKAHLVLRSTPADAQVFFDDVLIGTTPFEWQPDASGDEVALRFVKKGFKTIETQARLVVSESPNELEVALKRSGGTSKRPPRRKPPTKTQTGTRKVVTPRSSPTKKPSYEKL